MVFLRKAGYRSKVKKVLLWFAVVWNFSVEILESVGLHGSCFAVQNGYSGHVVPLKRGTLIDRNSQLERFIHTVLQISK